MQEKRGEGGGSKTYFLNICNIFFINFKRKNKNLMSIWIFLDYATFSREFAKQNDDF